MISLLCDQVPVWGLLSLGGLSGLEILPCSDIAIKRSRGLPGTPAIKRRHLECPQKHKVVFFQGLCPIQMLSVLPSVTIQVIQHDEDDVLLYSKIGRLWCSNYYAQVNIFLIVAV